MVRRLPLPAAGVAYADIMMRQGVYAGHKPPITPGYDLVGRVEAVGPGVEGLATVLKLVADGVLTPQAGATYPLRAAAEAHRAIKARSVTGKIVLLTD